MEIKRIYNDPVDENDITNKRYVDTNVKAVVDKTIADTLDNSLGNIVVDSVKNKNLFDISSVDWGRYEVITSDLTIESGSFTNSFTKHIYDIQPAEIISISANHTSNFRFGYMFLNNENRVITGRYMSKPETSFKFEGILVPDNAVKLSICQLDAPVNSNIKIQVEKGPVVTEYVPYKKYGYNSMDSMGEIVVDNIKCKNLFNINAMRYQTGQGVSASIIDDGLTLTCRGDTTFMAFNRYYLLDMRGLEGKTLTFSWDCFTNRADGLTNFTAELFLFSEDVSNRDVITWTASSGYSFTVPSNLGDKYLFTVTFIANNKDVSFKAGEYVRYANIQLELGNKKTPYTPYKSLGYTSGSNENGSWVKYDDGRLEVEGIAQCPAGVGYADITFPMAFVDTNYIMVASHKYTGGSGYGGSAQLLNITSPQNYSTTQGYIYSYLPDASFAGYPRNVQYIAIGRWK